MFMVAIVRFYKIILWMKINPESKPLDQELSKFERDLINKEVYSREIALLWANKNHLRTKTVLQALTKNKDLSTANIAYLTGQEVEQVQATIDALVGYGALAVGGEIDRPLYSIASRINPGRDVL